MELTAEASAKAVEKSEEERTSVARENERHARLRQIVHEAGELLPISGPISAFAFLNTLQSLEHLPFDQGLQAGAELYGCEPYLTVDQFREKLTQGRIRNEDLSAVLREDLGERADELVSGLSSRLDLRLSMLEYSLLAGPTAELRWFVAETDALRRLRKELSPAVRGKFLDETRHWVMRDLRRESTDNSSGPRVKPGDCGPQDLRDLLARFGEPSIERWDERTWEAFSLHVLWRICVRGAESLESPPTGTSVGIRHRDILRKVTHQDSDLLVHDVLIRFCAAFTDQGFAPVALPKRDQGFYLSFVDLYQRTGSPPDVWMRDLPQELRRLHAEGMGPIDSILESLEILGVDGAELDLFITKTLLALRGWAGMLYQMEVRGDRVPSPVPPDTLLEFLAIRLILERLALAYVARRHMNFHGSLRDLRRSARERIAGAPASTIEPRAFLVFQLAQLLGWSLPHLDNLTASEWGELIEEIEAFTSLEQRRTFHAAFERSLRIQILDAISIHARRPARRVKSPRFQTVYCLDAREESFRRHLEEYAPDTETFGAAGFFGVAMYYRGITDAHYVASCPIVVRPQHWVVEDVVYTLEEVHRQRAKARRALGTATHQVHLGSRSIAGGAMLTMGLGVFASIPLVTRVLFPRLTAMVRRTAGMLVEPPPITRLRLERGTTSAGSSGSQIGFTVDEMANIGERTLRDIGLTSGFARLVAFLGHGSFCLNNPHKSAYDCGACTGSPGGPNGRAIAAILNDARVRAILASHGLSIPADTVFLGGLHNTCDDTITFLDLDLLPKSHVKDFEDMKQTLDVVCQRNAHERCRRFYSAPLNISLTEAKRHVEDRAEDLAQTRPEFGNASNALCFVGRRSRIRGLFLDRRAFQMSYDPTQDDTEQNILARILSAVVPVCEGINMQYFLSYVDSTGWACGTKLPHNVSALLGVMDGAASDLRPGLPWQGVEIHEPVRCLFVIETTPDAMNLIMERNPVVGRILRNSWVQLAVLSPDSSELKVLRNGEFHPYQPQATELPKAASSIDWYRGWRDHLAFAEIES